MSCTLQPATSTLPCVGANSPMHSLSSVDLPEPLGPAPREVRHGWMVSCSSSHDSRLRASMHAATRQRTDDGEDLARADGEIHAAERRRSTGGEPAQQHAVGQVSATLVEAAPAFAPASPGLCSAGGGGKSRPHPPE